MLSRALDETLEKQKKQDRKKARVPIREEGNTETEKEIQAAFAKINKYKKDIAGMKKQLDGNLNEARITDLENQSRYLTKRIQELETENSALQKIEREQKKAIDIASNAQGYPEKLDSLRQEIKTLKDRYRELQQKQKQDEKVLKEQHEKCVDLEEKCRKLKGIIRQKKNEDDEPKVPEVTEKDIQELEEKIKETEQKKKEEERKLAEKRKEEEKRIAADKKKKIEDDKIKAEEDKRKAEQKRLAEEQKRQAKVVEETYEETDNTSYCGGVYCTKCSRDLKRSNYVLKCDVCNDKYLRTRQPPADNPSVTIPQNKSCMNCGVKVVKGEEVHCVRCFLQLKIFGEQASLCSGCVRTDKCYWIDAGDGEPKNMTLCGFCDEPKAKETIIKICNNCGDKICIVCLRKNPYVTQGICSHCHYRREPALL